jgi:hypothetical protein
MADERNSVLEQSLWHEVGGGNGEAPGPPPKREPVSANMLKRIAHCADGHRTGKELRIRIDSTPPFTAFEVIHAGAEEPVLGRGERLVGPFLTREDDDVLEKRRRVAKVVVHYDDGTSTDVTHADALFWSTSAIEKFCLPWYTSQYGPKAALKMWMDYAGDKDMVVLCHDPRCEACDADDGGVQNLERMLPGSCVS